MKFFCCHCNFQPH